MEIFLYTLSVMYSPGPVNFIGLNAGLKGQLSKTLMFFMGVGVAMLILFLIFAYIGQAIISPQLLRYVALMGALYTFFLAYKMYFSDVEVQTSSPQKLSFSNGFLIQALNPKGLLVILPVTTIMFPAAHITGYKIIVVSYLIAVGAAGAPLVYSFAGSVLGNKITNKKWLNPINKLMSIMLVISGIFMILQVFK